MIDIEFATIQISEIEISERARKELGDIKELANSIKSSGLINPLAVMRQEGNDKPYKLLSGTFRDLYF